MAHFYETILIILYLTQESVWAILGVMDQKTKESLRTSIVLLLSGLDEVTERNLLMSETLRDILPDYGRIYDEKSQARKNQQGAEFSRQTPPAIALLDELLKKL